MASGIAQASWRSELEFFDQIRKLEDTIDNLRRERDSIAAELAISRSENKRLQDELAILQQKLDVLQPRAILTRIEKTLELVDQMDAVQDIDSPYPQSSPHIPHSSRDFDDDSNDKEDDILDEVEEEAEDQSMEEEGKRGVHEKKMLAPDVSVKEELKPALSSCVICNFTYYDPTDYKRHQKSVHGFRHLHYPCNLCDHIAPRLARLERHIQKHGRPTNRISKPKGEQQLGAIDSESQHFSQEIVDLQASEDDIKADLLLKIEVEEAAAIEDTQNLESFENEKSLSGNFEDSGNEDDEVCNSQPEGSLQSFPLDEGTNDEETISSDCLVCDYTYDNSLDYKRHLKAAHGLKYKNFKCFHCGKVLQRLCALEKHMARQHKDAPKPGGHCTTVVIDEGSVPIKKIGKKRTEKIVRTCILCGFASDKRLGVLQHGMAEHGWTQTRRVCNQCPFVGSTAYSLRAHFESVHDGKKKQCTECGKIVSKTGLLRHIKSVHKQLRYNCPHCEHVAKRADYLTEHINFHHKGIRYYCDKCPYSAPTKGRLSLHMKTNHDETFVGRPPVTAAVRRRNRDPNAPPPRPRPPPEKKFHCDQCVFSAACNASLKEHIAVKHEGKRYYCDRCGYTSMGQQQLRHHIRTKHENLRFSCEHCDTRFMDENNFRRHKRKRLKQTKQFKCDICEMVFCFEIGLNKHKRRVHSSEKDILPCDECEKVFYSQQNLNRHKRVAHRMEKFSCGECDRVFNYRQTLNEHVRDKHMLAAKLEN